MILLHLHVSFSVHQSNHFLQVETVSLAFDFLKDETSSIFTDTDGNIEHIDTQQHNKLPVYRFRPPQIVPVPKYVSRLRKYSTFLVLLS